MNREKIILETITSSLIEEVKDKIIEYLDPDKLILFGSTAKEDDDPHDIDIYVIMRANSFWCSWWRELYHNYC